MSNNDRQNQKHAIFFVFYFLPVWLCANLVCQTVSFSAGKKIIHNKSYAALRKGNRHKENHQINNDLHEKQKSENKNILNATENTSSPVWSNAFNFHKIWSSEVDPRTGMFTIRIKVGSLISNLGRGPDIDLKINYNSNMMTNHDGLGKGWSWNLSHFSADTNQLLTSQGEHFNLQQSFEGYWHLRYHKLKDIQVTGSKDTHFVITYASGLREILNHKGCEVRLEQQNGRGVNFYYQPGGCLLNTISDDIGHKVKLARNTNYLTITSYDSTGKPVFVRLNYSNGNLYSVFSYDSHNKIRSAINIEYSGHLISNIAYPSGLEERIEYNCTDAMKLPWKYSDTNKSLCVVVRETVNPGSGQQKMVMHYTYQQTSENEHNYLAFNSGLPAIPGSYQDILFEAPVDYTYRTTKDDGITRQVFTYNKYHLLIDVQLISDRTEHLLSEKKNFFCRTDEANGCSHTSFKYLPTTYSLPLKFVTMKWGESFGPPATEIVTKSYDDHGRVISTTDAYGRTEKTNYCPANGDIFCPPEPAGWSLSTKIESVIDYPSAAVDGSSLLSAVTTHNYYRKVYNINGHDYTLDLARKEVTAGNQSITKTYQYYDNDKNNFNYGLLQKTVLTGSFTPGSTLAPVTKIYHYILSDDHSSKITYSAIDLGSGQFRQSSIVTTSLFTNQVLEKRDAQDNNITHYHYDYLGRLTQIDLAAGTPFAVSRYFQYTLSPQLNQIIITSENGMQQKIIFDGAGRRLIAFNEAISTTGKAEPGKWLPKQSITWDAYGRIASKHTYRVSDSGKIYKLTSLFDYDDTGRINYIYLPDEKRVVRQYDDSNHCVASYVQNNQGISSAISVIKSNVLDKPIRKIILPADDLSSFSLKEFCAANITLMGEKDSEIVYDGFGRVKMTIDPERKVVIKQYDSLGHVTDTINPAGDREHNVYNINGQMTEKWIRSHADHKQYLLSSAKYNAAGELLWRSGEDGQKTNYKYTYDGKVAMKITPTGHTISWQYNMQRLPVEELIDGKVFVQTVYDPVTLLPVKKTDITGTSVYTYGFDKKTEQLVHLGENGYPDYRLQWQYNRNREIISATDFSGCRTLTQYDDLGRVSSINYSTNNEKKVFLYSPSYDSFSRISKLHYGSGMDRTFHYNGYGQQDDVKDTLEGELLSEWKYNYDANGNITRLVQNTGYDQQGILDYQYDVLDNLVSMTCTGSAGLPLCPRDTSLHGSDSNTAPVIVKQYYEFNNLNRIKQVQEVLINQEQQQTVDKMVTYNYGDIKAPLRLQEIGTAWNNKETTENYFVYDAAGNMLTDGEGDKITYNAFNQITHVITPEGKQAYYTYDGNNREASEITPEGDKSYLLYINACLIGEKITDAQKETHLVRYLDIAKTVDGVIYEYYERDYKRDITGILTRMAGSNSYTLSQRNIYSPYGMVWHRRHISAPLYQKTLQGFDRERTDPVTGWQFLGAGHRTYNPTQRYFVSEDPAGDGYAFCSNNPVMNTDPDGNMPKWMGTIFHVMDYTGTLGLGSLHKKWASILGSSIMAGFTTAMTLIGAVTAGSTIPAIIGETALWGGLSFVSPVVNVLPESKTLNAVGAASSLIRIVKLAKMLAEMSNVSGLMLAISQINGVTATQAEESVSSLEVIDNDARLAVAQSENILSQGKTVTQGDTHISLTNDESTLSEAAKTSVLKIATSRTKKIFSLGRTPSRVHNLIHNGWFALHSYGKNTLESELTYAGKQSNIAGNLGIQNAGISAYSGESSQHSFMGDNAYIVDDHSKFQVKIIKTISERNFLQSVQSIELQPDN